MNARDVLLHFALKYDGNFDLMLSAIQKKERITAEEIEDDRKKNDLDFIAITDPEYPFGLKNIHKPPLILFYKGKIDLIKDFNKCVTIVGSREPTSYARKSVEKIAEELAKEGITIISGLAKGIDTSAALGALKYGRAVAILGNGVSYYYPSDNSSLQDEIGKNGLLLSEYPLALKPSKNNFVFRNRIMVGLSPFLLVGEAKDKSRTFSSVSYALENNRDIGCLPFRNEDDQCNNTLIQQGAALIKDASDVLAMLSN